MRHILVAVEAWPVGSQFEQRAARLLEVHRAKPEAVDLWRGLAPGALDGIMERHFFRIIPHAPGDMMHRARANNPTWRIRYFFYVNDLSRSTAFHAIAVPAIFNTQQRKTHLLGQKLRSWREFTLPHAHGVHPAQLVLSWHRAPFPRHNLARRSCFDQRQAQSIGVGEGQRRLTKACFGRAARHAKTLQARLPICQAPHRHRKRHLNRQANANAAGRWRDLGPRKKGDISARRAFLVGIKKVINLRHVLVDGLLHQAQPQHANIEIEILLRIVGDNRHMVDAMHSAGHIRSLRNH